MSRLTIAAAKSSQVVLNPHNSKSSQCRASINRVCACQALRCCSSGFSTSGWVDVYINTPSFLSLYIAADHLASLHELSLNVSAFVKTSEWVLQMTLCSPNRLMDSVTALTSFTALFLKHLGALNTKTLGRVDKEILKGDQRRHIAIEAHGLGKGCYLAHIFPSSRFLHDELFLAMQRMYGNSLHWLVKRSTLVR
jgi:hypothetical protein